MVFVVYATVMKVVGGVFVRFFVRPSACHAYFQTSKQFSARSRRQGQSAVKIGPGELGISGAGAAVANARFNACGVRIRDFPLTLDKVMLALPVAA
jgi:CO/xanthine dehydrogenase Mo-binding subunit